VRGRWQSTVDELMELRWQTSVVAASCVYLLIRFAIPFVFSASAVTAGIAHAAREYAWIFGVLFLIPAPFAAFRQYRRKKLLDGQADIESIRALSWQQFEKLVAVAFQRMGYSVREYGGSSPDGGVDFVATAPGEKLLVQCKHWRSLSVGVSVVREHYGAMLKERASAGAIVVTGSFTPDAIAFVTGKPIQLIDGPQLERLVLSVKRARTPPAHVGRYSSSASE
jgi:restriction system protein